MPAEYLSDANINSQSQFDNGNRNGGSQNSMNEEFLGFNNSNINNHAGNLGFNDPQSFGQNSSQYGGNLHSYGNANVNQDFGLIPDGMTEDEALMEAIRMSEQG